MRLIDQLALLTAFVATVSSATPLAVKKERFTVQQTVSKSSASSNGGPAALAQVYRKYHSKVPARLRKAVMKVTQKDATVTASPNDGDEEYTAVVTIGGQTLNLNFDTGSSDLWVYSSLMPKEQVGNHSFYDPQKSTGSARAQDTNWKIQYGDGSSANGDVYFDSVSVGGATASVQAVGVAANVSQQFLEDFSNDGLLGLGFDNGNTIKPNKQKTFFTNVRPTLALPLFTADLKRAAPGSYDFGFIDSAKHSGEIIYVPANSSQGFWGVTSTGYAVGNDKLNDKKIEAIIDTGTTLMLVPESMAADYYKQVKGATNSPATGGWVFPCDTILPDFHVAFGTYTAHIPGPLFNSSTLTDKKTCFGGIQTTPPDQGLDAIYGDVFFKSTFVVFKAPEGEPPELGFAAKPGDVVATPTAPSKANPSSTTNSSATTTETDSSTTTITSDSSAVSTSTEASKSATSTRSSDSPESSSFANTMEDGGDVSSSGDDVAEDGDIDD